MTKNDNNKKPATTEAQEDAETQNLSASAKFSASVVARETLLKEIDELKRKLEESENKYKRALADYQNLEKRVAEDKREWMLTANKNLLLRILPILDTLMLAVKHSGDESLHVSINQFLDILKSEGVTRIETKDKDFDPGLMEGIERVTGEKDKVIEETRAGYMLNDNVLRPAQVKVGKGL